MTPPAREPLTVAETFSATVFGLLPKLRAAIVLDASYATSATGAKFTSNPYAARNAARSLFSVRTSEFESAPIWTAPGAGSPASRVTGPPS